MTPILSRIGSRLRANPLAARLLGYENTLWTRKVVDEATRSLVSALEPERLDVLEISGELWADFGFRSYRATEFPEFDITRDVLPRTFHLVLMEHVLEHVVDPARALRNAFAMLAPGGHLLTVTPFIYQVHRNPIDYGRWTEHGIEHLLRTACPGTGVTTGAWGNRAVIRAMLRREYRRYNRFLHPLRNEPNYPVVVWALARRPDRCPPMDAAPLDEG